MNDRVMFVFGGASGIGAATAEALRDRGNRVVVFDAVGPVRSIDGVEYRIADVRDPAVGAIIEEVAQRTGPPAGLVYAVGVMDNHAFLEETTDELLDVVLDINVKGAVRVARAVAPAMRAVRYGRIVFIGSIAGVVAGAGGLAYTISKHALGGVVRSLAVEMAPDGVTVNCVAPGAISGTSISTRVVDQAKAAVPTARGTADLFGQSAEQLHPVGRLGTPDAVVASILHLLTPESWFVTGSTITVDGGYTAR